MSRRLLAIGLLIGGQGALGWYMVKSGLTHEGLAEANPSGVPRVSQYRLAAHLGMAFAVYALCLRSAFGILRDWRMAVRGVGVGGIKDVSEAWRALRLPAAGRVRLLFGGFTGLVFLTALSGVSLNEWFSKRLTRLRRCVRGRPRRWTALQHLSPHGRPPDSAY
jgi:cytochrome c oxidase assembly protein subunit 15